MSTAARALGVLLRFGTMMLRAGDTSFRVHEALQRLAPRLGLSDLALLVTLTGLSASARHGGETVALLHQVGPLGINASRLGVLEQLAREGPAALEPDALEARLDAIEASGALHSALAVAVFVGLASAAFAALNGGGLGEMLPAFVAGGLGQALRLLLLKRHLNQYAVTAACAALAAGLYCLATYLLARAGLAPGPGIGLIAAVLFLVPGFPLVAGLLDLLQHQTLAGLARLAYGTLLLLAAAFGLGAVVAVAGLATPGAGPPQADLAVTLLLRGVASFIGGCGFAVLYNSAWRTVLAVGVLALVGNELRLALQDAGVAQAAATFAGALAVGLQASLIRGPLAVPRLTLTVPGVIIMIPGSYALRSVVLFAAGDVLGGLQQAVLAGFVVGAMALGLAAARFISERKWLFES